MGISIVTAALAEPVSYQEIKEWINIEHDEDREKLENRILPAARTQFENLLRVVCVETEFRLSIPCFPQVYDRLHYPIVFPKNPLLDASSTTIEYYTDDTLTTWASTNYEIISDQNVSSIKLADGKFFPETDIRKDAVQITFKAGFASTQTAVPVDIKNAICMMAHAMYIPGMYCSPDEAKKAVLSYAGHRRVVDERIDNHLVLGYAR